jgi:TolA-binding protein
MLIAESLEAQGARDAAAEAYAAVVAHPAASPGLRLELGVRAAEVEIASGHRDDARAVLEAALRDSQGPQPLADRAAFLLADLDLSAGRSLPAARDTFADLAQRGSQPDLARRARWRLADVTFAEGDCETAERLYAALEREAPGLEFALPPAPPGLNLFGPGLPLLPAEFPEEALQADPRTTPAYAALRVAECLFRRGEFDRAKALFAQVAETYPDSVYANDAVERRLFVATHFANPRPATEGYLAALTGSSTRDWPTTLAGLRGIATAGLTEPLADDAALLVASLLEARGQAAEAAAEYRALPDAFPGSLLAPEALLSAARLARSLGDDTRAREDLSNLLRNYPTAPMAKTAALWLDDLDHGRPWPAP